MHLRAKCVCLIAQDWRWNQLSDSVDHDATGLQRTDATAHCASFSVGSDKIVGMRVFRLRLSIVSVRVFGWPNMTMPASVVARLQGLNKLRPAVCRHAAIRVRLIGLHATGPHRGSASASEVLIRTRPKRRLMHAPPLRSITYVPIQTLDAQLVWSSLPVAAI